MQFAPKPRDRAQNHASLESLFVAYQRTRALTLLRQAIDAGSEPAGIKIEEGGLL